MYFKLCLKVIRRVKPLFVVDKMDNRTAIAENGRMGREKFNLCSKCDLRHAAPTGKSCSAGDGEQFGKQIGGDGKLRREQNPKQVSLDVCSNSTLPQKVVKIDSQI